MTRAYPVPSPGATALGGAVGGAVGGAAALVVLSVGGLLAGHRAVAGANAVGAWLVRWLQSAAPDAIEHFYWDATLGGVVVAVAAAGLLGAVFALVLARLPHDHPLAWGVLVAVVAWFALRSAVGPALDPVLVRVFDWRVLLPACMAYGLVVGGWVHLGRRTAAGVVRRADRA